MLLVLKSKLQHQHIGVDATLTLTLSNEYCTIVDKQNNQFPNQATKDKNRLFILSDMTLSDLGNVSKTRCVRPLLSIWIIAAVGLDVIWMLAEDLLCTKQKVMQQLKLFTKLVQRMSVLFIAQKIFLPCSKKSAFHCVHV